ncbi:membrane protein FxsA [Amphibacillus sp. MSJ-3]|uniref:FxsA family protein n=1 Tax=Amphibacillus sp. MSJ-3 TaxID=2841505 RepID=UPI001C0E91EE|nr:FxsA family protein [Amphibacillus sp. MSJ-3]MBU5593662.1 membrane protein FxsA [Amphibacillus sp. MSJ-3]
MLKWLLLLIISVPILEIVLLIWASSSVGVWSVIGLIVLTGLIGLTLAKHEGIDTLRRAQQNMQQGQLPAEEILDGICILFGGILLLIPGFITDIAGLLLMLPFTRPYFKNWLKAIIQNMINRGNTIIYRRF